MGIVQGEMDSRGSVASTLPPSYEGMEVHRVRECMHACVPQFGHVLLGIGGAMVTAALPANQTIAAARGLTALQNVPHWRPQGRTMGGGGDQGKPARGHGPDVWARAAG